MPKKKKLIVRLKGGLGNQLFSFATAYSIAESNDYELVLDTQSGFAYDSIYNRYFALGSFNIKSRHASRLERLVPFDRIRRYFKKKFSNNKKLSNRNYIVETSQEFDPALKDITLEKDTVYLDGLWQNLLYFEDHELDIKKNLTFNISPNEKNIEFSEWMGSNEVAVVHLRFFSAHKQSNKSEDASLKYYRDAIEYLTKNTKATSFAIFTDDVLAAEVFLKGLGISFSLVAWNQEDGHEIFDLWLMTQGSHFILANSTFSWWSAWLSESAKDGLTIYPCLINNKDDSKSWSWAFPGQMPKHWIPLPV